MTVQELIDQLSKFDPSTNVKHYISIESGRSLSISDDTEIFDISLHNGDVFIEISGEETDYQ